MNKSQNELAPSDHLPLDNSEGLITDPKKAAHMAYAAHAIYRDYEGYEKARSMMEKWHQETQQPLETADQIKQAAKRRVGKRALESGDFSKLNAYDMKPREFNRNGADYASRIENVDDDMIVAHYAEDLANRANNDHAALKKIPTKKFNDNPDLNRQTAMAREADEAGERYDENVARLSSRL